MFFWEEPYLDADEKHGGAATLEVMREGAQLWVVRPHLPRTGDANAMLRGLLDRFLAAQQVERFVRWYYTPMMLGFSGHLHAAATVYDCMDELSGFLGAPPELKEREAQLFHDADVVFTGGMSLYEAKRRQHGNVHAFPSSIEVEHFAAAHPAAEEPADQRGIPHPRAGFYGVLDERFDSALMSEVARLRPEVHFVLLGPTVKIDPATLPQGANLHYPGAKSYAELPSYLAGWDVALLPFALNESTRFISPTKTPEYLAGGKPVVSTPIQDVISGYGRSGLVAIAGTAQEFAEAVDRALAFAAKPESAEYRAWKAAVEEKLSQGSWDRTWESMWRLIMKAVRSHAEPSAEVRVAEPVAGFRLGPVTVSTVSSSLSAPLSSPLSGDRQMAMRSKAVRQERFDYVIAGAGFAGSVIAERLANGMGKRVLLVDKRDHVGGNTYDFLDASGILVHKYGPHIFHTNSNEVVQYLSRFTEWRPYEHRVLASVDGMMVPIPINLDTINTLYGLNLDAAGMQRFLAERTVTPATIRTSEEICCSRVGRELYEKFFRNYTRKQWGLDPSELDASVAGRIPVRFDRDDRYFTDTFQAMPLHGYTRMFERMLDSRNITVRTGVDYAEVAKLYPGVRTVFTGPVDEFFDYRFGPLPYRSLEFEHRSLKQEWFQSAPVVNYPNEHPYTRITEFKYLTGQQSACTSIVYEHPRAEGDPYYPIPRPENAALYARYRELAERQTDVHFVGRLATYRYYNMDQVVAQALVTYRKILEAEAPRVEVAAVAVPASTAGVQG